MTCSGGMESLKQATSKVAGEAVTEVRERQGIRQSLRLRRRRDIVGGGD